MEGASLERADSLYGMGRALALAGSDTLKAIDLLVRAARDYQSVEPPNWAGVLNSYGAICSATNISQYADTALYYAIAADSVVRVHDPKLDDLQAAIVYRFMALAFSEGNQFDKARSYGLRALDQAYASRDPQAIGKAQDVLAQVHVEIGDFPSAIELERSNIAMLSGQLDTAMIQRSDIHRELEDAETVIGSAFKNMGMIDSALHHTRLSYHHAKLGEAPTYLLGANEANLGMAHFFTFISFDSTVHYIELAEARLANAEAEERKVLNEALPWKALACTAIGRSADARTTARHELDRLFAYGSGKPVFNWTSGSIPTLRILDLYACTYEELYKQTRDTADARMAWRLSDDIIRGHAETFKDADPGSLIAASRDRAMHMNRYITFLDSSHAQLSAAKLVSLFETKRSDHLRAQLQGVEDLGLGSHNLRAYRALVAERDLVKGTSPAEVSERVRLGHAVDSVRHLIASFTSTSAAVDGDALLHAVRANMEDSTLVLNYSWADDDNGAFLQMLAITEREHWFDVKPLRPFIDSLVRAQLNDVKGTELRTGQHALVAALLPPGVDLTPYRHIIILPDGPLNALPFESLVVAERNGQPVYLMDAHEVHYEYCLSFLGGATKDAERGDVLACAPDFSAPDTSWAALDPERSVRTAAPAYLRDGFGPLTGNVDEVLSIVDLIPGKVVEGKAIDEGELRKSMEGRSVLHFATHAVCSAKRPEFSGIILSTHSTSPANIDTASRSGTLDRMDGVLHAYEIQSMDLPVDLVVLSACETALGKERQGEGAMSIARAFKYAGARSIVSSLWKVDDLATKEIMVKFYEFLAEGVGKADALAEAKRWYRKEYPNEPPSKWAAFILIGDNEPVHLKKRSDGWPLFGGGAVVVLITALAARRRRRQRLAA